jgi:hypothetical protein
MCTLGWGASWVRVETYFGSIIDAILGRGNLGERGNLALQRHKNRATIHVNLTTPAKPISPITHLSPIISIHYKLLPTVNKN